MIFQTFKRIFLRFSSSSRQCLNAITLYSNERIKHRGSMRVFIIDPSLRVLGGHHLSQAKCLLAESSAMGIPCTILGNLSTEPRTLGLSIWRHFRISGYGAVEHDEHYQKYTAKKTNSISRFKMAFFKALPRRQSSPLPRSDKESGIGNLPMDSKA